MQLIALQASDLWLENQGIDAIGKLTRKTDSGVPFRFQAAFTGLAPVIAIDLTEPNGSGQSMMTDVRTAFDRQTGWG